MGTAAALLAAGCGSTGTTGAGPAGSGGGTSLTPPNSPATPATEETPPNEAFTTASSSASAPTAPAGKISVYGCDRQPVSQPTTYTLACGDGGMLLEQLVWTGWGKAKATATGVQMQNSCVPSCAAGAPVSTKATVTLSALIGGRYTKLRVATAKGATDYTIDARGPLAAG